MRIIRFISKFFSLLWMKNPYYHVNQFKKYGKRLKFKYAFKMALKQTKSFKQIFKEAKKEYERFQNNG